MHPTLQHPEYGVGPGFTPNDIAIVTISGAVQGSPTAGEIAPNANNPEVDGWITGWGRTCGKLSRELPNHLICFLNSQS